MVSAAAAAAAGLAAAATTAVGVRVTVRGDGGEEEEEQGRRCRRERGVRRRVGGASVGLRRLRFDLVGWRQRLALGALGRAGAVAG